MDTQHIAILAGMVSTIIFTTSYIPMLTRAFRTRDLHSYSVVNLALGNLGNGVHWLYVANLPFGPIWFLHGFYTVVNAVMLLWYLRYTCQWVLVLHRRAPRKQPARGARTRRLFRAFIHTSSAVVSCSGSGSSQR